MSAPIKDTALKDVDLLNEAHLTLLIQQSMVGKWNTTDVYSALMAKSQHNEPAFQKLSSTESLAGFTTLANVCQLGAEDNNLFLSEMLMLLTEAPHLVAEQSI